MWGRMRAGCGVRAGAVESAFRRLQVIAARLNFLVTSLNAYERFQKCGPTLNS